MQASRRSILAGLSLAPLLAAEAAQARPRRSAGPKVDAFMRARMEAKGIPGAALAIVRGGRPARVAAYGRASVEFDIAASPQTVFAMASSSKLLAGLLRAS